jgi:hypothetical protein
MKSNFRFIWFFILFLELPVPARAEVEDGSVVDPAIIEPLMRWVESQTGTKVPVLPQVIASRSHFNRLLSRMGGRLSGRPQSLYVPGTVYMDSERWDPNEPTQIGLLVHELVHHAQYFMQHVTWPCSKAKENQAYSLQNRWLEQHDHAPFVNVAFITRAASCPDSGSVSLLAQN